MYCISLILQGGKGGKNKPGSGFALVKSKSKFIIPRNIVNDISFAERDKMLKKACVEAFVTAQARNERMRQNKWLRYEKRTLTKRTKNCKKAI